MVRYLFLDIDGVLNNHVKNKENQYCGLNYKNIKQLNKVLKIYHNINIILSSAWRYMIHGGAMTYTGFGYMMKVAGILDNFNIITITDKDEEISSRENQILDTLSRLGSPANFVILDDLDLKFPEDIMNKFVRTDGTKGLTSENVKQILKLFKEIKYD